MTNTGRALRRRWKKYETSGSGWVLTDEAKARQLADELRDYSKRNRPEYRVTVQKRIVRSNTYALKVWAVTVRKRA